MYCQLLRFLFQQEQLFLEQKKELKEQLLMKMQREQMEQEGSASFIFTTLLHYFDLTCLDRIGTQESSH